MPATGVKQALNGAWEGQFFWGELQICTQTLHRESKLKAWQAKLSFCQELQLAFVGSWEAEEIYNLRAHSSLYCFGLVQGPFSLAAKQIGWIELLRMFADQPQKVKDMVADYTAVSRLHIANLVAAGAHGIVLGDDICSANGPLFSERHLVDYLEPAYQQLAANIKATAADGVFHCCGRARGLAPWLQRLGWRGLHGFDCLAEISGLAESQPNGFCYLGGLTPAVSPRDTIAQLRSVRAQLCNNRHPNRPFLLCSSGGLHTKADIKWARAVLGPLCEEAVKHEIN